MRAKRDGWVARWVLLAVAGWAMVHSDKGCLGILHATPLGKTLPASSLEHISLLTPSFSSLCPCPSNFSSGLSLCVLVSACHVHLSLLLRPCLWVSVPGKRGWVGYVGARS